MKSLFLNIALVLATSILGLSNTSCSKTDTNFSVDGKLENLSVSSIYAVKEISRDSIFIDTIAVNSKGEFSYKGNVEYPTLVSLACGEGIRPITFFLDTNYVVKIKGDVLEPDLVEIKGGEVNDDLQAFRDKNSSLLQSRARALGKNENLDLAELKNINFQLARSVRGYVEANPAKIASVILINQYSLNNLSADLLGKDIHMLKGAASSFYLTSSLKEFHNRVLNSSEGAIAPDITLKTTKGKNVSLQDFRGKPVLLIFDLKGSPLNVSYFDALKEAQKKLKNKVHFVSIVIDEDEINPDPKTIEIANSLDWTVLLDGKKWSSKEVKKYNVRTAPFMFLISSEGIIEQRDVVLDSLVLQFDKEKISPTTNQGLK